MIDSFQELKLKLLKKNLKQEWNLASDLWNEEFPNDYMFEDTFLQLTFVFNTFTQCELLKLVTLTEDHSKIGINRNIVIEITNYINSCVTYINFEMKNETEEYFKKFKKKLMFFIRKKNQATFKRYLIQIFIYR